MSMTEFAMVEELAFLIKDNLSCKHLVLSVEEAMVDFLENNTSPDGILELKPMSSYNRLLLHRLADIFGFAHESVGEGDDRHLVLERCPDSSIPSILVSDILWQSNDYQSPVTSQLILRREEEALPVIKENPKSLGTTLEEREAAYNAARERIFSAENDETKDSTPPKPRNVPVVARRMIAHALGQRIRSNSKEASPSPSPSPSPRELQGERKGEKKSFNKTMSSGSSGRIVSKEELKQEHMGAAKRMFAHALGLQGMKDITNG